MQILNINKITQTLIVLPHPNVFIGVHFFLQFNSYNFKVCDRGLSSCTFRAGRSLQSLILLSLEIDSVPRNGERRRPIKNEILILSAHDLVRSPSPHFIVGNGEIVKAIDVEEFSPCPAINEMCDFLTPQF